MIYKTPFDIEGFTEEDVVSDGAMVDPDLLTHISYRAIHSQIARQ